jgi:hypothetical protein
VDHLLFCGADPGLATAAGELPIELVPVCGDKPPGGSGRCCRCMGPGDQEVWECRSKLARSIIARRCIFTYSGALAAWLRMALLCVLACLGLWGTHTSLARPAVQSHLQARRARRRREELQRVGGRGQPTRPCLRAPASTASARPVCSCCLCAAGRPVRCDVFRAGRAALRVLRAGRRCGG